MSYEHPDEQEVIDGETGEIVSREVMLRPAAPPATLFGTNDPELVLQKATQLARPLATLIKQQKLFTQIGAKQYVSVEGWTTLGSMLGVFPVLESCEPVELNGIKGYVAIVNAQKADGSVVGRAQSYCMRNETKWSSAKDYAVASMAQTRATSKALRMPLGFIMQLAGYAPTPAEEREADQVSAGAAAAGNASQSEPGSTAATRPRTTQDALAKVWEGLTLLEGQKGWALDEVLAQCSIQYARPIESLDDLLLRELNEILVGMRQYGGIDI